MSSDAEKIQEIKDFMEKNPSACLKCFIWDVAAREFGKRGMCQECFEKNCVSVNCCQHKREF